MGISEEIAELNKRLAALVKKQDEFKTLLAVEEHKVVELTASLKEGGIEVAGLDAEQLEDLSASLLESLIKSKAELEEDLTKAEGLYSKLETLR